MSLLHAHQSTGGLFWEIFEEIFIHGLLDTIKLVPFLFLTYLLMEFIEHKASDRVEGFMKRAGGFGPLVGGALGAFPQCGFSASAANLYAARVLSVGTLIAVFLSTSDEMLPVMVSGGMPIQNILVILAYKVVSGIIVGFLADLAVGLMSKPREDINIDAICDEDNCHCERGIFYSALHHTVTISGFVLLVTLVINSLVFFVGTEALSSLLHGLPVVSHLCSAVFGLIPNCAVSVALTSFFAEGIITAGTMMSGLFSGAGVGILVLFRVNKSVKENIYIVLTLVLAGVLFGLIFDLAFLGFLV